MRSINRSTDHEAVLLFPDLKYTNGATAISSVKSVNRNSFLKKRLKTRPLWLRNIRISVVVKVRVT
jgi:hypothetical protein